MAQSFPTLEIGPLSHSLEAAVISIGRADDNMVVLDDASVSGHHAEIEQTESGLVVRDLGSTNGTKVNGSPVTTAPLNEGDQICFGSVLATIAASLSSKDQEHTEQKARERSLIQTTPPRGRVKLIALALVAILTVITSGWWLLFNKPTAASAIASSTQGRYAEYPVVGEEVTAALQRFNRTSESLKTVEKGSGVTEQQMIIAKFTPSPTHAIDVRIRDGYVIGFIYVSDDKSLAHAQAVARDIKAIYAATTKSLGDDIILPGTGGDTLDIVSFIDGMVIACSNRFSDAFFQSYELKEQGNKTAAQQKSASNSSTQSTGAGANGSAKIPLEQHLSSETPVSGRNATKWVGSVAGASPLGARNVIFGSSRSELSKQTDDTYHFFQSDKLIGVTKSWSLDGQTFDALWDNVMRNFVHGNVFDRREYKTSGINFTEAWIGFKDAIVILVGNKKTNEAWRPPPDAVKAHVIGFDYIRDGMGIQLESFVDSILSVVNTNDASGVQVSRFGDKTVVTNKNLPKDSVDPWRASRRKELRTTSEVESEASGIAKSESDLRQRILADSLISQLNAEKIDPYRNADTGDYGFKLQDGTLITVSSADQVTITKPSTF